MSAVPFCPGIDIWRSCRFIGALCRALTVLPGGIGRFVPCSFAANHCRLRNIGWEKCGYGLTSRPRESASELFLNELLGLFRYPHFSASGKCLWSFLGSALAVSGNSQNLRNFPHAPTGGWVGSQHLLCLFVSFRVLTCVRLGPSVQLIPPDFV